MERLIKGACGYNTGPYRSELKQKSWAQYVSTSGNTENVRYGILVKCCLGLELSSAERSWIARNKGLSASGVDSFARTYYQKSHGLC